MAQEGKRMPTRTQRDNTTWSYQDEDKIVNNVQNIMKWGSGQMDSYDPVLIAKTNQALNMVDDYAHWVSQEEIDDKYNSIPHSFKVTLKKASQWVNAKWRMTNFELTEQAKSNGVKLSDSEKNLLQERPWIQQSYLQVKKKSSSISTEQMEANMWTILKDIQSWKLQNINQLKVRLMTVLNMDNVDDVDYLAEDLWSDFTTNKTDNEKLQRVRTKYKELFWFEDRTDLQKTKETAYWLLNWFSKAVTNWVHWLTEAWTDTALSLGYGMSKVFGEEAFIPKDVDLWGIDENALSPETKEMVEKVRAYGLWSWVIDAMDAYFKAQEETYDKTLDEFFKDASYPVKEDAKDSQLTEQNSNYYQGWEFAGKLIPEIYLTSRIGAMMSMDLVKNAPWYLQFWYKLLRGGIEWTAFSIMEEWEVDKTEVGIYTASSTLLDPVINNTINKIGRRGIKKRMWKEAWNSAVESVMNYSEKQWVKVTEEKLITSAEKEVVNNISKKWAGGITRKEAENIVADIVAQSLPWEWKLLTSSNTLDTSVKYADEFISKLQKSIVDDLWWVSGKYENKYIQKMLKWVFKQSPKEVDEAYSVFRNSRIWAWASEEAVAKEWEMMKKLYESWTSEFSLVEQEQIKQNMRTIANTYSKTDKPLNGRLNEWWRDQQISAQNLIEWYAKEQGIDNLSNRYLQESVIIRAKNGFEKNATKSMSDIINRYAGRTLIWGLWGYVASQTIWQWPFSNPYVATACTILAMGMWWSPRASMTVSRLANRLSVIEAYSIIDSADQWILGKLTEWTPEWFAEAFRGIIYADTIDAIIEDMEWHSQNDYTFFQDEEELDAWMLDAVRQQYDLY